MAPNPNRAKVQTDWIHWIDGTQRGGQLFNRLPVVRSACQQAQFSVRRLRCGRPKGCATQKEKCPSTGPNQHPDQTASPSTQEHVESFRRRAFGGVCHVFFGSGCNPLLGHEGLVKLNERTRHTFGGMRVPPSREHGGFQRPMPAQQSRQTSNKTARVFLLKSPVHEAVKHLQVAFIVIPHKAPWRVIHPLHQRVQAFQDGHAVAPCERR